MGRGCKQQEVAPSPGGILFLLAQKKNEKKGSHAALTTPGGNGVETSCRPMFLSFRRAQRGEIYKYFSEL